MIVKSISPKQPYVWTYGSWRAVETQSVTFSIAVFYYVKYSKDIECDSMVKWRDYRKTAVSVHTHDSLAGCCWGACEIQSASTIALLMDQEPQEAHFTCSPPTCRLMSPKYSTPRWWPGFANISGWAVIQMQDPIRIRQFSIFGC